ncbi:MAG: hypothetical protein US83_C0010G0036 [Candidatus Falkowbacteria bacterium GW2011_GWC2_38_22]|uniref:Uncharacterized protein n=1 Tax=Candidatus Falkowbacteria bacterium GW2011_GWE1_38_31 TaxID=1618638 RepID=A0A0G0JRQ9_9BACT|nr:MAG: hypothetical protein US73_C0005G0036 [Candidatus Falkowbacteria bacterium GW2011_GWF2_38_1205]KKQ61002.1 MAG: hypothetical protein US83_C0010G0036 [Candidatus Falkowbacteria bacterium GW2011_GWC2_38_22]KKQ63469.1 MAG: hypothetical protein US84_C0006G0072 [Candidatus Falkowbacteria bacterium GW2011_GWF1_38_22]KKQ65460.1 MAG: hypothetical protein US87_C0007G0036 [Candidatus Falkowbacteria bacterium GW2011_GWE2_38_254]KKQ70233.1 MAG: hypothetical protein US91_C0006G0072 [Candidatus Falkowb
MARNTETIDYTNDYYRGFAGFYFRKILETIIEFGNLRNESEIILDFGCGIGHLKKTLNKNNIINYDIEPSLTEISDYKTIKPKKIVLSGVLEHLYLNEIENLLKEFIKINNSVELLVYLPTENFVSKIAMLLAGQKNAHDDHVSNYREINKLLKNQFILKKRKYIFARMAQISYYARR